MKKLNDQILRFPELVSATGKRRSTIYNHLSKDSKYYDPTFPQPIKLGNGRSVGFLLSEVQDWINLRVSERNK